MIQILEGEKTIAEIRSEAASTEDYLILAYMLGEKIIKKVENWLREINSASICPKSILKSFDEISLIALKIPLKACRVKKALLVRWLAPPKGRLKLNFDGSWRNSNDAGGVGGVVRDDKCTLVLAYAFSLQCCSALYAEAYSLFQGLLLCYSCEIYGISVESDALELVKGIKSGKIPHMALANVWEEIMVLYDLIGTRVDHIYREQNEVADLLAKLGFNGANFSCFSSLVLPRKVRSSMCLDGLGIPKVRMKYE